MPGFRSVLKKIGRLFVVGLMTALPFIITLFVFYWIISTIEEVAAKPFEALVPERYQFPGMGIVAIILLVSVIGVLIRVIAGRKILDFFERLMGRIPLAKMIYGSTKDIMHLFSRDKSFFNRVVLVSIPNSGCKMVGLVTRDGFGGIAGLGPDMVSVYIPISYQIGGYMMLVPRAELHEVDMSVEEAIRLILTAGVSTQGGNARGALPVLNSLGINAALPADDPAALPPDSTPPVR